MGNYDVARFIEAQAGSYERALAEIRQGRKRSHWIWFIFPQVEGLGHSLMCQRYGIRGLGEAAAYLADPLLAKRLTQVSRALLALPTRDAQAILGGIDARKVRSSMTLFALVEGSDPVFRQVLDEFYDASPDELTLDLLGVAWPYGPGTAEQV